MHETRYRHCDGCDSCTEHAAQRGLMDMATHSTDWECLDCGHVLTNDW